MIGNPEGFGVEEPKFTFDAATEQGEDQSEQKIADRLASVRAAQEQAETPRGMHMLAETHRDAIMQVDEIAQRLEAGDFDHMDEDDDHLAELKQMYKSYYPGWTSAELTKLADQWSELNKELFAKSLEQQKQLGQ